MKKTKIIELLLVISAIILMVVGVILGYDKEPVKNKSEKEEVEVHPDYHEIGSKSLKEEQVFDNIKYTENHLSTTSNSYATFTSVVYNETKSKITFQKIEIDFYNKEGEFITTMQSEIENVDVGKSTVIFGIVEQDLSLAHAFKVRQI